ncbi:MAG TPA: hypothetical protein VFB74_35700 [Kribbellaceae bacterium]|nr:hypothetical protein [Kribbellaceae bacterium]
MSSAKECRIARAAGVESEMELAFAGLHQLCRPYLEHLDRLPTPQLEAIGTAFGLRAGGVPDRFHVGLAVLTLLSEASATQPMVCVVDDAQWLDDASLQTLAFVARRLVADSIALVFAIREPLDAHPLAGLTELAVGGLADDEARALLESVVTGPLDERVRDRIVAETHGNPLALLELPRSLTPEELAGGFGLPDAPALTGRIEDEFRRRLEPLPAPTRRWPTSAGPDHLGRCVWSGLVEVDQASTTPAKESGGGRRTARPARSSPDSTSTQRTSAGRG